MYLFMACRDEPLLSARTLIAFTIMSMYFGWEAGALAGLVFAADIAILFSSRDFTNPVIVACEKRFGHETCDVYF